MASASVSGHARAGHVIRGPALLLLLTLAGCAMGPDYQRPAVATPAAYKEYAGWKAAAPGETSVPGRGWEVYDDAILSELVARLAVSNQDLQAAEARYRQAMATLVAARAGYFPTLTGNSSMTHSRAGVAGDSARAGISRTTHQLSLTASWELDLWGRVRRTVEANTASADASAADVAAVLLSTQSTVAQTYIELRVAEAQRRLLQENVEAYARAAKITSNRYTAGVASRLDVSQAETQLKSTEAAAIDLQVQCAQLEHALATLVGQSPADFQLTAHAELPRLPKIPLTLPSELLERRPDIAAAERRTAAANANIGVAQAAYYPTISLGATAGFQSPNVVNLFSLPNNFWSVGPALAQSLFDGGLRRGQKQQAMAVYDETVAQYRQTVLNAFQEVEDNLAALRILADEAVVQDDAARTAAASEELALNQYKAGTVSYLNVVAAQTIALTASRAALEIRGRQLLASVGLLKAIGGDWRAATGGNPPQVEP